MAAMASLEASSTRCSYQVFLSFRGKDTRKTFTDHLYRALLNAGIHTFRDDDELERGDDISSRLIKAIEESRVSIIVFSKDYAFSTWCLDELLKVLERKKSVGHVILSVFYHVDPSDLKSLNGSFGDAFAKHEKRLESKSNEEKEKGMDKIKRWKEALGEVAGLSAHVLGEDEYETDFIQKIIEDIGNKLNNKVLCVCQYPVGMDSRIKDINLWLQDGSSKVVIMTIYGMGGIGKTAIAKTLYNLNFDKFEGSSFLANIRETSKEPKGLVSLQKQLLSDILKGRKVKISNVDRGSVMIKDHICLKRVLLVLDDVDQLDQLNAMLSTRDWIKRGSKIIITSRHKQLLKAHELYETHCVEQLGNDESLQLFSWHAFEQDHPVEAYMEQSIKVVKYCGGLPLALEVLGTSLSGRSVDLWESAVKKLEGIPNKKIIEKLKISFDSLEDDHDKNLFLDIACFFVGKNQDFVITVLDGCEYSTKFGIDNLIKRCLLNIYNKKLTIPQLLQDMGREIIRQESPKEQWKRSRLWHHEDALNVLREKTGTEAIEGLILNLHGSKSLERHRLTSTLTESSSTPNEEDLQTDAFSTMHALRLLQLNNARLAGNYEKFPKKLIWLCWRGFSLEIIPIEFPLESLVVLEMTYSSLKQVCEETKFFKSLKILNVSHSHGLTSTPNFSKLPNLERLIFKDCINLIEVDESIGELERLVLVNLKGCRKLKSLPKLPTSLNYLDIRNCRSMEMVANLPNMLGSLLFIMLGCGKLVQVEGVFKLEPIGTVDAEIINILGLSNFELLGNVKVNLYSNMTFTERKVRLQVRSLSLSLSPLCVCEREVFEIIIYCCRGSMNLECLAHFFQGMRFQSRLAIRAPSLQYVLTCLQFLISRFKA
ncbi:disease resistance protein RPV1-like isoform X2 [Cornus florida]|uniref:disease resistance protein RPV1-like isoform X2 n=1 Tax=Cornus florida TaxID=4283 RepID=UPI002897B07B|nr:disease resistance protein RPV1-like isoform X2 [Cornus florida]